MLLLIEIRLTLVLTLDWSTPHVNVFKIEKNHHEINKFLSTEIMIFNPSLISTCMMIFRYKTDKRFKTRFIIYFFSCLWNQNLCRLPLMLKLAPKLNLKPHKHKQVTRMKDCLTGLRMMLLRPLNLKPRWVALVAARRGHNIHRKKSG